MSPIFKRTSSESTKPIFRRSSEENEDLSQDQDYRDEESFLSKLPRNILAGLAQGGHKLLNAPHDSIANLENQFRTIGEITRPHFAGGQSATTPKISEYIPKQDEYNFAQMLGQEGEGTFADKFVQKGAEYAPELLGAVGLGRRLLQQTPVSARGISNLISQHKTEQLANARRDYGQLFNQAAERGVTHALPSRGTRAARNQITTHSTPKYHESFNNYLDEPTIENAHWAQSELNSLRRHLISIDEKTGLTPTQHRTLRAVTNARNDIRSSMFDENVFGHQPDLAHRYTELTNQYRQNVVPYTRLKDLTEFEQGRMTPQSLVKKLQKDDQFSIELRRRYPGLTARSLAKKLGIGTSVAGGIATAYKGLKGLMK